MCLHCDEIFLFTDTGIPEFGIKGTMQNPPKGEIHKVRLLPYFTLIWVGEYLECKIVQYDYLRAQYTILTFGDI